MPQRSAAEAAAAPRDLTPQPGRALDEHAFELSPDGRVAVTGWSVDDGAGGLRKDLVVIDTGTGERRTLLSAPGFDFTAPRVSPDGKRVVAIRERHETYHQASALTVVQVPLDADRWTRRSSAGRGSADGPAETLDLLPGLEHWPAELAWAPDGSAVFITTADHGRGPVLRADLDTGAVTRLSTDHGAYSCLCPSPDGQFLYALRSAMDSPPLVVRLDATQPGEPEFLQGPAAPPPLPGRLDEIEAAAADGTPLRAWLVLPESASPDTPAPLLLWVHGGPYSSWNSWSWRWNPWLMAARGYAVLLPDPGLSTGYGHEFLARGHGDWGDLPFTDLMDITDAALARPDLDAGRTAVMGGSFGGYMANWIAGHTTRFRAIVSHASLWALEQMFGTTDCPAEWRRQLGTPATQPERYAASSPDRHVAAISTPMLVIHGDKDYRVPIGEALRLWTDLAARPGQLAGSKFLYFPDENHWVLGPGNSRHLVRDRVRLSRPARARRALAASRAALSGPRLCQAGPMTRANLDKRPGEVSAMFDKVAGRYDLMNDVLSLGQDRWWRRIVARAVGAQAGELVLDLAAGTGTSSRSFTAAGASCVACDFSLGMLQVGARRLRSAQAEPAGRPGRRRGPVPCGSWRATLSSCPSATRPSTR